MVIRPVQENDLDSLYQLAQNTGHGLTTLPADKDALEEKIAASLAAFEADLDAPLDEYYLLVLENTATKEIVGTSGIASAVGRKQAFYTYRLATVVHASPSVGVFNETKMLTLTNDFTNATEICTLFLDPEHRKDGNGSLLSKSRFLLMADYGQRFADTVIAEMRGFSDDNGISPFWEALGRKFFSMEFPKADKLSAMQSNEFISELMPRAPIYVSMLTDEAQQILGQVHPDTKPALRMLEREGFEYRNYVDIFDAGPTIQVRRPNITTIKNSSLLTIEDIKDKLYAESVMMSNARCKGFRACYGEVQENDDLATISRETAERLQVKVGDKIRVK